MSTNPLFDISKSEFQRILEMHKNATKNNYLLKEQNEVKTESKKIPLNVNWGTGKWKLTAQQTSDLSQKLIEMTNFINQHKDSKVTIQIRAGESRITNYDREVEPKVAVDPGVLSERRGTSLVTFLKGYFDGLLKRGAIKNMPEIPNPQIIIGDTPYENAEDLKDTLKMEKYNSEQFVEAIISLEKSYDCVVGMEITIGYFEEKGQRGHNCDEAIFDLKLNGISLGEVNLNNNVMDWGLNVHKELEKSLEQSYQEKLDKVTSEWESRVRNGTVLDTPEEKQKYIQRKLPRPKRLDYSSWVYEYARKNGYDNVEKFVSDLESLNNSFDKYGRVKHTKGGSRSQTFVIDNEQAKKIVANTNSDKLVLSIKPLVDKQGKYKIFYYEGSHSDTPWVIIKNKNSKSPIYDGQPNVSMLRGDVTEKVILQTDLCGNPIKK